MSALPLTRRMGESIYIGDDIKITIGKIQPKQVQILIEAPKDI